MADVPKHTPGPIYAFNKVRGHPTGWTTAGATNGGDDFAMLACFGPDGEMMAKGLAEALNRAIAAALKMHFDAP